MCSAADFIASAKRKEELQKMHLAILEIFLLSAVRMLGTGWLCDRQKEMMRRSAPASD
ncbi:hypothetical protein KRZ98_15390 [Sphingobium sp. AS12]|uniref:hypothetical protein n=1 Tax=Sphingobium sp. AS12 TaxID=2849495 RepID=UPI001C316D6B|nr:hypothetical protein [Sphingobium sp. AS12]MBV2149655.1 hypothetical protein [Sphingobium sp. AS12]